MNRRDFLIGGAAGVVVGAGGTYLAVKSAKKPAPAPVAAPVVSKAEPVVLKVQAAWGGGIFLENAKGYVDRVNAMAGSGLKIDLLSVNSVVKTSQMQDAVHRGVLDGAHVSGP